MDTGVSPNTSVRIGCDSGFVERRATCHACVYTPPHSQYLIGNTTLILYHHVEGCPLPPLGSITEIDMLQMISIHVYVRMYIHVHVHVHTPYRQGDISTNRGNFLLIQLLQERFVLKSFLHSSLNFPCLCRCPCIVTEQTLSTLWQWLRADNESDRSKFSLSDHT